MGDNEDTDPGFMVEIGSHRFDPKEEATRSRNRATAGRKRLAEALGVEPAQIPGSDRQAWLVQLAEEPDIGTVQRLRDDFDFSVTTWFGHSGNDFQGLVSRRRYVLAPGITIPPDPTELRNNVRQVVVDGPVAGRWSIFVAAHKVDQVNTPKTFIFPRRVQGYALVACVEVN